MRAKKFQMFDEGPALKVGTGHLPPVYPLSQIQVPMVLFEGTADTLQDSSLKHLPSLVGKHCINGYEHLDFMFAKTVDEHVWPLIIKYLNQLKSSVKQTEPLSPPPEMSKDLLMEAFREFLNRNGHDNGHSNLDKKDLEFCGVDK